MIPVRQTKFKDTHGTGNCLSACIASILERDLKDVICTAQVILDTNDDGYRFWEIVEEWFNNEGLTLKLSSYDFSLPNQYIIATGDSPRGNFLHSVVYKHGVMVFDPHHSDDGIIGAPKFYHIIETKG